MENQAGPTTLPKPTEAEAKGVDDDGEEDTEGVMIEEAEQETVELGFAVPIIRDQLQQVPIDGAADILFNNPNWHDWDGGKVGGLPQWLNPRDLPMPENMACEHCAEPLSFLLQIYCPIDDEEEEEEGGGGVGTETEIWNEDAFHRAMYVFCCSKAICVSKGGGAIKALRCQLPQRNDFYAYEPDDDDEASFHGGPYATHVTTINLCALCGQRAVSACSGCRKVFYCGRVHQKLHWKAAHKAVCGKEDTTSPRGGSGGGGGGGGSAPAFKQVFQEMELIVESEKDALTSYQKKQTAEQAALLDRHKDVKLEDAGEDADLSQHLMDSIAFDATGASSIADNKDPVTLRFLARTSAAKQQVLRYARWGKGKPMWTSSSNIPDERAMDIPPCACCGSKRQFEFQIMPQLLHYLGTEQNSRVNQQVLKQAIEKKQQELQQQQQQQQGGGKMDGGDKGEMNKESGGVCVGRGDAVSIGVTMSESSPLAAVPSHETWQGKNAIDWGTLAVYTCPKSCPARVHSAKDEHTSGGGLSAYVEEFVWRQPPVF